MPKLIKQKADGYIVIIVLLLTAVLLMLGLSLATRTTEEVYQSGQEADTTRVFNAAETGIEEALSLMQSGSVTVVSETETPITVTNITSATNANLNVTGQIVREFQFKVKQGEVLTVPWNEGTIIKWTHNPNCSDAAAIVVTAYKKDGSTVTAYHVAYDPFMSIGQAACEKGSGFDSAVLDETLPSGDVVSKVTLTDATFGGPSLNAANGDILRILPLYNDATFNMENSTATQLVATATDETTDAGVETRKIQVIRTDPAPPSIFDYAVFSGGSLVKP